MVKNLINGKDIKEIILEYLGNKSFVSIGELNTHCSEPIRDTSKPAPAIEDNYLFFLMLSNSVKELESDGKLIVRNIDSQIWVKIKNDTN